MTYGEILDQLRDLAAQEEGDDFDSVLKTASNLIYFELLDSTHQGLETRTFTLTSVSGTAKYGLPIEVAHVLDIQDPDNNRSLDLISRTLYDRTYPSTDEAGTPQRAVRMGVFGVEKQPLYSGVAISAVADATGGIITVTTSAVHGLAAGNAVTISGTTSYNANYTVLTVPTTSTYTVTATYVASETGTSTQIAGLITLESSSTADDGADFKVVLRGRASNVPVRESVTMDGTTAVNSANHFDISDGVERITLAPANGKTFTGNVILKDNAGNTLATVPPFWGDSPDYQWVELHPQPDAAITYNVRAEMRKPPLINDEDWPELGVEFHNLLVQGVVASVFHSIGRSTLADRAATTYRQGLRRMRSRQGREGSRYRTFRTVSSAGISGPVGRPLIPDVDV